VESDTCGLALWHIGLWEESSVHFHGRRDTLQTYYDHANFRYAPLFTATTFTYISKQGLFFIKSKACAIILLITLARSIKKPYSTFHPVRLAYQPPASSTFVSEQTSHQQPASSTFLSEQTSTSHQPPAKRSRLFVTNVSLSIYIYPLRPPYLPIGKVHDGS
jgi:hypothetical protein